MLFKLPAAKYAELEAKIKELHGYDNPEIIATTIERGSPDYLAWLDAETGTNP